MGYDFPTQDNDLTSAELEVSHRFNPKVALAVRWRYEDFSLEDFQWDGLQPYGANFLTVDDATRYLFLDSRYSDYDANIIGAFLKIAL